MIKDGFKYLDLSGVYASLSIHGADALDLLDRLTTNKLMDLTDVGMGMGSVLTSNKGRIIDLLYVFKLADSILVITSYEARDKVCEWIDFYTITEDVLVEENSDQLGYHRVVGTGVVDLFPQMAGLKPLQAREISVGSVSCLAFLPDVKSLTAIDFLVPTEFTAQFNTYWRGRADFIDSDGFDRMRIFNGIPVYGKELTSKFNPLEAGLIRHISFNKGCYIGQEVVARLNTYDKVQMQLVKLSLPMSVLDPVIQNGAKTIGLITSTNNEIGLGYVRNAYVAEGTVLKSGECLIEVLGTV